MPVSPERISNWPWPGSSTDRSGTGWRRLNAIDILRRPCPKYDERPPGQRPQLIVIHFSATRTAEEIFDIFIRGPERVSSHYVIDDQGAIFRLVPESKRAWHAGRSVFGGRVDVNSRSIGIELRNGGRLTPAGGDDLLFRTVQGRLFRPSNPVVRVDGDWWESYAEAQLTSLALLCRDISQRHAIPPEKFVGHSQLATPPGRKIDPGPLFDWERLRREASLSS